MNEENRFAMKEVFDFKFLVGSKIHSIDSVKSNSIMRKNRKNYLVIKEVLIYKDLLDDIIDGKLDDGIMIFGESFGRGTDGIDREVKLKSNCAKLEEFYIDSYCDSVAHMKMVFLLEKSDENEKDYTFTFGDNK